MNNPTENLERFAGIVERVTFHNEQNGWSVLKVTSFRDPARMTTILIHQAKVFAGATMEFWGGHGAIIQNTVSNSRQFAPSKKTQLLPLLLRNI